MDTLHVLERRGLTKRLNETPLAFSTRAAQVDPRVGDPLGELVDLLYRIRFGGYDPTDGDLDHANELVLSLRGSFVHS